MLAFGAFLLLCVVMVGGWELIAGSTGIGLMTATGLVPLWLIARWLHRGGSVRRVIVCLMAALFFIVAMMSVLTAGQAIGTHIALPTFVLFAALLSKRREAIFWFACAVLTIGIAFSLRQLGVTPWIKPDPSSVALAIYRIPLLMSFAALLIGLSIQRAAIRFTREIDAARNRQESINLDAQAVAARLSSFTDIAADGFWETDADLRLTYVSPRFARKLADDEPTLLGLTPGDALLQQFPQAEGVVAFMQQLMEHDGAPEQLISLVSADGQLTGLLCHAHRIQSEDGSFAGYRGAILDISRQLQLQQSAQEGEKRLRTITDNLPALISYIDANMVFRFNNETYAQWLDRPVDQITGKRLDEVFTAATYQLIEPHIHRALAGEQVEFELAATTQRQRHVHATYVPDRDPDGNVVGVYGLIQDLTELKRVETELRRLSEHDALTGLANRRLLSEKLDAAIARSARSRRPIAVLYADIDQFKLINDNFGHEAGDMALCEFAVRLLRCVRETDLVARLAGDEFVVVLEPVASADDAALVAQKILTSIAATPFALSTQTHPLTASIGVAVRTPDGVDQQTLLRQADRALYQAKDAGRNQFCIATAP